ncbi:MAG: hypothetical protein WCJ34_07975 [Alcaligenaceae bacterium]
MTVKQCVLAVALVIQIYNVASQEVPSLPIIFSDKFKFGFGGLNVLTLPFVGIILIFVAIMFVFPELIAWLPSKVQ